MGCCGSKAEEPTSLDAIPVGGEADKPKETQPEPEPEPVTAVIETVAKPEAAPNPLPAKCEAGATAMPAVEPEGVKIKTGHVTYIGATPEGAIIGSATKAAAWETFKIRKDGDGKLGFDTCHGTMIHACPDGRVIAVQRNQMGAWETFESVDGGLRTCHGTFLSVAPTGEVTQAAKMGGLDEAITLEGSSTPEPKPIKPTAPEPEPEPEPVTAVVEFEATAFVRAGPKIRVGDHLGHDGGMDKVTDWVFYDVATRGGLYELSACYASPEARPVQIQINGVILEQEVMTEAGVGADWRDYQWRTLGVLDMGAAGSTEFGFCGGFCPHIKTWKLTPALSDVVASLSPAKPAEPAARPEAASNPEPTKPEAAAGQKHWDDAPDIDDETETQSLK
jgi:hypothetical protein